MDIGEIVFEEFNQWVYNDENQAGDKLQVIDASDLPEIIQNVVKKYNDIHNVSKRSCDKPCSPSDWYEGGKCDKNGCYHK